MLILQNEEACKLIKELLPQIYVFAIGKNDGFKVNSIRSANLLPNFGYSQDIIKKVDEELSKIKP